MSRKGLRRKAGDRAAQALAVTSVLIACVLPACAVRREPAADAVPRELKVRELLRLGTVALRAGDSFSLEEAQAYFELALELQPGDPRVLDGLGSVAFRSGSLERAELLFRQALQLAPHYDRALEHLAVVAAARGDDLRAALLSRAAVSANPLNYRARNNLAVELRSPSGALSDFRHQARAELLKARGALRRMETGILADEEPLARNLGEPLTPVTSPAGAFTEQFSDKHDRGH